MKPIWFAIVACLLVLPGMAGAAPAQLDPSVRAAIVAAVNKELKAYGGPQPIPGAVIGVWIPGKGEFTEGIGYSNLDPRTPMAIDDKFRIGSNTKTFVATVLLQLVDEKKLTLDDTIANFNLGLNVPNESKITLRQLAEMRSGIIDAYSIPAVQKQPDTWWNTRTPEQWVAVAAKEPPLFAPGAKYNYSNTNWMILGLIIEKTPAIRSKVRSQTHPHADGADANLVSDYRDGDALAVRARLFARREEAVEERVGRALPVGFLGRGRDDLRYGRYAEVGQSLRHRHDQ